MCDKISVRTKHVKLRKTFLQHGIYQTCENQPSSIKAKFLQLTIRQKKPKIKKRKEHFCNITKYLCKSHYIHLKLKTIKQWEIKYYSLLHDCQAGHQIAANIVAKNFPLPYTQPKQLPFEVLK